MEPHHVAAVDTGLSTGTVTGTLVGLAVLLCVVGVMKVREIRRDWGTGRGGLHRLRSLLNPEPLHVVVLLGGLAVPVGLFLLGVWVGHGPH